MSQPDEDAEFERKMNALGIDLPPDEIAQLRRAFARQRAALLSWEGQVPPTTEPALVFLLPGGSAATADDAAAG